MKDSSKSGVKNLKLRNIRTEAGVTQDEIAEALGMTRSAYQHLETKGNLSGDVLFKLSRFFGRPIEDFIEGIDAILQGFAQDSTQNFDRTILSKEEKQLLEYFSLLSPEAKARALGYLNGLSSQQ